MGICLTLSEMDKWKFIICWLGCMLLSSATSDPCVDYEELADTRRLASYETTAVDALCDIYVFSNRWYRFMVGNGQIATSPVPTSRCGTDETIFMLGDHPTDDTIVARSVCNNFDGGVCNDWRGSISIRRCLDEENHAFYVYALESVPWCPMAYCVAGEQADYPPLTQPPLISDPVHDGDYTDPFSFECSIYCNDFNANVRFEVGLYFAESENTAVNENNLQRSETQIVGRHREVTIASFNESYLFQHMGSHVGCFVRTFYDGNTTFSPTSFSINTYWIGIRIPNNFLHITEGMLAQIEILATVPITCSSCPVTDDATCRLVLYARAGNLCNLVFVANTRTAIFEVTVSLPDIPLNQLRTQTMYLEYSARARNPRNHPHCIWNNYALPTVPIPIHISDEQQYKQCLSVGDPHILTFDLYRFDNYYGGIFVLFDSPAKHFQVQVIQRPCNRPGITCNCAVAAREYNTVFIVNMCGQTMNYKKIWNDDGNPMGSIDWPSATTFEIIFPSGAKIIGNIITHRSARNYEAGHLVGQAINIVVELPSIFQGQMGNWGLCGNFDGNESNDHQYGVGEYSRIAVDNSLFWEYECIPNLPSHPQCTCSGTASYLCNFVSTNGGVDLIQRCNNGNGRGKKSIFDENDYDIYYTESEYSTNLEYPTASGYTEQDVINSCQELLRAAEFYSLCRDLIDEETYMANCVTDSTLSDDLTVGYTFLSTVAEECLFTAESGYSEDVTIIQSIQLSICPDQCLNLGQCVNSSCICNNGFIGDNCGISLSDIPSINEFGHGSMCDVNEVDCRSVIVYAQPLTNLLNLKCMVQNVQLSEDGNHLVNEVRQEVASTFLNYWTMVCDLPISPVHQEFNGERQPNHGYMVSVSIDGETFSEPELYVIYNSNCTECNEEGECWYMENTCFANGECNTVECPEERQEVVEQSGATHLVPYLELWVWLVLWLVL